MPCSDGTRSDANRATTGPCVIGGDGRPVMYPAVPRPHGGSGTRPIGGARLAADSPLVGPSDHRECEPALPQRRDQQAAPRVGGIRLRVARGAECDQAVEMEARAAWARLTT